MWYDFIFGWGRDRTPPNPPVLLSVEVRQVMRFLYSFAVVAPSEPVTRSAVISVDGETTTERLVDNQLAVEFTLGQLVTVTFVDTDAAGNDSEPLTAIDAFTIIDNVPPMRPEVALVVTQLPDEATDAPTGEGDAIVGDAPEDVEGGEPVADQPPTAGEPTPPQAGGEVNETPGV